MHHYTVHRSPSHFSPLPDVFWPDRWLTQDTYMLPSGAVVRRDELTTDRAAFIPFSHGPMNCAGKHLALLELRMVVCALLQRFRIRLAEGWDLREYGRGFKDYLVAGRPEVPFVLEAR